MALEWIRRGVARLLRDDFHRYRAAAAAVTVVGIALSAMAFVAAGRQETQEVEHEFGDHARSSVAAIRLAVELGFSDVESAGALFDLGSEVTRQQFHAFGQRLLRRTPPLNAIAWAPRVPDERRGAFEARARLELPGYAISERDAGFRVVPAQRRAEYFPVYYSEDRAGKSPFGFDTGAAAERRELLMRSRRTGEALATSRIRIQTGEFAGHFGVSLVRPVYRSGAPAGTAEERERNHVGFATAIIAVGRLAGSVLERIEVDGLRVAVYDDSAPPQERFLAVWPDQAQEDPGRPATATGNQGLRFQETINVGGRTWTIAVTPLAGRFDAAYSWRPWAVLVAGLLFSLLLAVLLESTRRHARSMREQAITDPLTGLYNRRYLWEVLKLEFARARRKGTPLSAIMLDIDHFKRINDSFGHEGGDLVLARLGALLKSGVRGTDVACRFGGEEFVLLMAEAPLGFVERRAEAIRAAVTGLELDYRGRKLGPVTVSLGIAVFPVHAADADTLLAKADAALYEAKRAGRDRVVACRSPAAEPASGLAPTGSVKQ